MSRSVSVIVPCRNEAETIEALLEALYHQTFPLSEFEVVIADGKSEDGTRAAIDRFRSAHSEMVVRVVENPRQTIPAALNLAIEHAEGDTLVRLDAHAVPQRDYIEKCLQVLERTGAANVGGLWEIEPRRPDWRARGIAVAASHPLGAGDARYRIGGRAGVVDTVPFGAFSRQWYLRAGPFDESLLSNEDYEFNLRLRQAGGIVWFDPAIRAVYYARPTLRSLGRQYFRYGLWKARMLRRHPRSIRWRQALPPIFLATLLGLGAIAWMWRPASWLLAGAIAIYAVTLLLVAGWEAARRRDALLLPGIVLAAAMIQLCWAAGFWVGVFSPNRGPGRMR